MNHNYEYVITNKSHQLSRREDQQNEIMKLKDKIGELERLLVDDEQEQTIGINCNESSLVDWFR